MQLINKGIRILEITNVTLREKKTDYQPPKSQLKWETSCCYSLEKWELNGLEAQNCDNDFVIDKMKNLSIHTPQKGKRCFKKKIHFKKSILNHFLSDHHSRVMPI